jgi:hypothetical protein
LSCQPRRNPADNEPYSNLGAVHDDICSASQGGQAGRCRNEGATEAATFGAERLDSRFGWHLNLIIRVKPLDDGEATFRIEAPRKLHSEVNCTVAIQGINHPDNGGRHSFWHGFVPSAGRYKWVGRDASAPEKSHLPPAQVEAQSQPAGSIAG